MKKTTLDNIKTMLADFFQRQAEIEIAYIFGSIARGTESALSDIDIAILIDDQQINEDKFRYGYKAEILADLMKILKKNNVDLVILNEANTLLRHRVLYHGKLIYSKNEKKRIEFQTNTIDKYIDFKELMKPHFTAGGLH
jgi:hypothetical protein